MKAIFFEKHGEIDVLKYADFEDPTPKPGYALIKVTACALNHLDIWVRRGWKGLQLELPHITGSDIVGEIVNVNSTSSTWKKGNRVVINPGLVTIEDEWTRSGLESVSPGYRIIGEHIRGGMAEYVTVPVKNVFDAPSHLSDEELAAGTLVGVTCWRMLFKQGQLCTGETVLIVGAGGGVNSLAAQLATAAGARVFVLAGGPEKCKKAEVLGADQIIDYKANPNWQIEILKRTKGRGVDLVVDNVGAATLNKSLVAVKRGGRIVTVGNTSGFEVH